MNNFRLETDILTRAKELKNAEASGITPKIGTSASFLQYFVIAGGDAIKSVKAKDEPEITANNERYAKKYADELNLPIIANQNDEIKAIKEVTRNHFQKGIDARRKQIKYARKAPIRKESMELLQTIKLMIELDADISESDWKTWAEQFAGHPMEERIFAGLAKKKGIDIIPTSDLEKSLENLDVFEQMGNIAIDHLDHPEENITAMSFLSTNPNNPLHKLMDDIDKDLASIVPAEKLTIMQRLKDAKETAYKRDNVKLSAEIGSFISKHEIELSTPSELMEPLYAEAENLIQQGMNAKSELK